MTGIKSGFDSIMSVFRQTAPVQQTQQTPQNNPTVPTTENTPTSTGEVKAIPPSGEGEKSPLEGFNELWQTSDKDPKRPSLAPDIKLDPKAIAESVGRIDFTKNIKPETYKAALEGNAEAFAQAINQAVQAGVGTVTATFTSGMQQMLAKQEKNFHDIVMPDLLRRHTASSAISDGNPIFDHPAVKPMLDMAKQQLIQKYPTATPAEIADQAKVLVNGMAGEIIKANGGTITDSAGTQTGGAAKKAPDTFDWSDWATKN